MSKSDLVSCVKIVACICGKDGVISEAEEDVMKELLAKSFLSYTDKLFEQAMDEFFASDKQIEQYLGSITEVTLQRLTLQLAEISASADGLEIRENIALQKAYAFWGISDRA